MKRMATLIAAVLIFITAWSVNQSQRQLDAQYKQIFAQNESQTKTEQKTPTVATPEKPSEASTVENVQTPEPVVETPPVVVTQAVGGCESYRSIVSQYDWDVRTAMAVMQQESTMNGIPCNPNARNDADNHMSWAGCMGSFGLFQINCSHGQLFDPAQNVAVAYSMYKARGWQPWSAYTTGAYAKYLR